MEISDASRLLLIVVGGTLALVAALVLWQESRRR